MQNADAPHGLTQGPLRGGYNGRLYDSQDVLFNDDRWHCVEAMFQLNTLDLKADKPNADGVVRGWFDGKLVIDRSDVVLRSTDFPKMKFNQFLLTPYFGPGPAPARTDAVDRRTGRRHQTPRPDRAPLSRTGRRRKGSKAVEKRWRKAGSNSVRRDCCRRADQLQALFSIERVSLCEHNRSQAARLLAAPADTSGPKAQPFSQRTGNALVIRSPRETIQPSISSPRRPNGPTVPTPGFARTHPLARRLSAAWSAL